MDKKLNKQQLTAVTHGSGPLLIIAGAGTGKTTVITERIKYLILDKNTNPSEILALTFTEKAAMEMEERVDKVMPYGYTQMWISTFHSFCDKILRQEAIHIGLNPSYKLLTEAESILLIRKNLFKFNLKYFRPLGNPNKFLGGLLQHFSRLKDEDVSVNEYLRFSKNLKRKKKQDKQEVEKTIELANAYKAYEELKTKDGVMDFSDLISNTLNLFKKRKNILKNYQLQFKYILVDEFQDTNYAQNKLTELLSGEKKNITVVGDDDQSIYRFRGSSISNIIQFKEKFPKTKIVTLTKNYRSTKEILDRAYNLIQFNNPDRLEAKEKINKKLKSARNISGENISFSFSDRAEDEADSVAEKINKLTQNNTFQFKDIAILVRANNHAQAFIRAFERKRIPFQFLGPGKLFQREEIKNLVSYLKILYNFEDSISLYRVLTMSIFKLNAIEIASLLNLSKRKNYSLFETLEKVDESFLSQQTKEKIKNISKMIKKHLKLVPKESAGQILFYFLQDSGFLKEIINPKTEKDELAAKNMAKFFDKLKTYETERETATVFEVVDWIDLSMQVGESPLSTDFDWTENNAVNILSIHSSKGLEFPVVFLVNLVSERFPTRQRKEIIPIPSEFIKEILPSGDFHIGEERRLFYVGMTRARDLLFMTASKYYSEGKRERKVSPFVYESLGEKNIIKILEKDNSKDNRQLSLLNWEQTAQIDIPVSSNISINYLSYSQIQTFDICPLHYKLKYILKIPTPQTSAQSFGTSVHTSLRDFYQSWIAGQKIAKRDIESLIKKNWINEGYQSKEHEAKTFKKAKQIILSYLEKNFDEKKLPIKLEYPFNFMIKNLKIGGRIDRIDLLKDNKIEIIDYKTGTNIPDEKFLAKNMQLAVYALAITELRDKILYKKPEDIILSFYYLEEGKKISTIRTKEQLEETKEKILEKSKQIANSDFVCSKNRLCLTCEYKILCSA
ncbi:MAG: ATP-dependent DNA helicase [Candidatus Levyibacteriota bacterium]